MTNVYMTHIRQKVVMCSSHLYCLLDTISVALQHSGMDYEHVFRKLLERQGTLGYQVNNNRESKDFIM